jgi:hypothetical protein
MLGERRLFFPPSPLGGEGLGVRGAAFRIKTPLTPNPSPSRGEGRLIPAARLMARSPDRAQFIRHLPSKKTVCIATSARQKYNSGMNAESIYHHLENRPCSAYRQPYIKGTRVRAEIPYAETIEKIDDDGSVTPGRTPEQVAADYRLPLEGVLDAIEWCKKHWDVVMADHAAEDRLIEAHGMNHPDYYKDPKKYYKFLAPEERAHIYDDETLPG